MTDSSQKLSKKALELVTRLSLDRASQVFSKLIRSGAKIELLNNQFVDISEITSKIAANNNEMIGVIVELEGIQSMKFLFMARVHDAIYIKNLMLRREDNITEGLDTFTISAMQEVGNILASAISNVFATNMGGIVSPGIPVIVNDYRASIFQEFIFDFAIQKEEVMLVECRFDLVRIDFSCDMFLIHNCDLDDETSKKAV